MSYDIKIGDLVRYVKHPNSTTPNIITGSMLPVGIILKIDDIIVGYAESSSIMTIVTVRWSIDKWNIDSGTSEENPCDLEIIQRLK